MSPDLPSLPRGDLVPQRLGGGWCVQRASSLAAACMFSPLPGFSLLTHVLLGAFGLTFLASFGNSGRRRLATALEAAEKGGRGATGTGIRGRTCPIGAVAHTGRARQGCVAGGQFGPRQPPVDTPRREKAEPRGRGTGQRWAVPQSATATVTHRVPGRARSVIVALPRSARGASLTSVPVTAGAAPAPRSRGLPAAPPPPVQSRLRRQPASGPGESASQGDGRLVSAFGN